MDTLPIIHREKIGKDWIDYNGHMNEGYYPLVFSHAADVLMVNVGVSPEYIQKTEKTFFTVESHTRFLKEVKLGATVAIRIQVLGVRDKKLHLWYSMTDGDNGPEAATMESMWLFYDGKEGKVAPIASEIRHRIDDMVASQGERPSPDAAGRHIAL